MNSQLRTGRNKNRSFTKKYDKTDLSVAQTQFGNVFFQRCLDYAPKCKLLQSFTNYKILTNLICYSIIVPVGALKCQYERCVQLINKSIKSWQQKHYSIKVICAQVRQFFLACSYFQTG